MISAAHCAKLQELLERPGIPFVHRTKGIPNNNFVIVSWGLPLKRRPKGLDDTLYGVHKGSSRERVHFNEITKSQRATPTKRHFVVPLRETPKELRESIRYPKKETGITRLRRNQLVAELQAKKILLKLKPWNYLSSSSDAGFPIRARAVLQSVKPKLRLSSWLLCESLRAIRIGDRDNSRRHLHILYHRYKMHDHSIGNTMITRHIRWCIGFVKHARQVLRVLDISCRDLSTPVVQADRCRTSQLFSEL
jgi:hypothetical protein